MSSSIITNQKEIIRELLGTEQSIGIIIGQDQNIDSVAAGLALMLVLSASEKPAQVVSRKEPSVEVSSLFGVDRISKSFEGQTKILTISVPYREGEIDKVSYNIEGDKLNVNLFAENSGITFSESDIQYIRKGSSPSLIITIGVLDEAELASFVDPKAVRTIHINKNPMSGLIGDVSLIDPSFSSNSEIVTLLIQELGLIYDGDAFQNLMDGIAYATRNFTLQTTSATAFEAAGFLMQNGARRKERSERQSTRNDAQRTFPREDYFLNQRSPRQNQPQNRGQNQTQTGTQWPPKQDQNSPQTQPQSTSQSNFPGLSQDNFEDPDLNQPNINKAGGETENAIPDEIPDDWFLPKVFKGSRKGN